VADEQVLMEVRDTHANHHGEHEVGGQLCPQRNRRSPNDTTDRFGPTIGQVCQVRHVTVGLQIQLSQHRRAVRTDGTMRKQQNLILPNLRPDQRPVPPVLRADRTVQLGFLRHHHRTVASLNDITVTAALSNEPEVRPVP
jgi:hypothetical protein